MNPIYKFYIHRPTVNLLDPGLMMKGYYLDSATGGVAQSATMQVSEYMPVVPGTEYALKNSQNIAMAFIAVAFYDASKTFISGAAGNLLEEAPAGAAYARTSLPLSYDVSEWQFADATLDFSEHVSSVAYPLYRDDLTMNFEKQSGQEFFRRKLSGTLTFVGPDYAYIMAQDFDHEFKVEIFISHNGGKVWSSYWKGEFWKTDCSFNEDSKTIVVTPTINDDYVAVLAGLEKEFDLITLAPEIVTVKGDKRPALQFFSIYGGNPPTIGCYLSGMWWEQECQTPESYTDLQNMGFNICGDYVIAKITQTIGDPTLPAALFGGNPQPNWSAGWECSAGGYKFICEGIGGGVYGYRIVEVATDTTLWITTYGSASPLYETLHLIPYPGGPATGEIDVYIDTAQIWGRIVCDVDAPGAVEIGPDDIVMNNRNYRYAIPTTIDFVGVVVLSSEFSETPTEWGLRQPGQYYKQPESATPALMFPLTRKQWGAVSMWVDASQIPASVDADYRGQFTLRDAFPIAAVISALLGQIAPGITHEATTDYSRFLYGETDPLTSEPHNLFISPKSNLVYADYDQPAQKAPIRIVDVLNMLRDCYRCYWFIDDQKRFRIEHIEFFRRGGTYSEIPGPAIGVDLTQEIVTRNGKPWATAQNAYKFEKPDMAAWYQFGWMDDVTKKFNGSPIKILSKYVNPDKIEEITVSNFTSDVDYMLLNPAAVSKDGFALFDGRYNEGKTIQVFDLSTYPQLSRQLGTDGKWMSNSNKHILIPVTAGQRIKITAGSVNPPQLAWFTSDETPVVGEDAPLVNSTGRFSQQRNTTWFYVVPPGANFLYVFWGQTSDPGAYLPASVILVEPAAYYLPYVAIGNGNYAQNGTLAFFYLQIYYNWDMPAKNYEIDGQSYTAAGVKKLKTQDVSFPAPYDPNMYQLVKSALGDGMIGKLSINLCSRNAKATLRYDTE